MPLSLCTLLLFFKVILPLLIPVHHSCFFGEDSSAIGCNKHRPLVLFIRPSVPSGLLSLQEAVGTIHFFQPAKSCLCVRQKLTEDSKILPSVDLAFKIALLPISVHI